MYSWLFSSILAILVGFVLIKSYGKNIYLLGTSQKFWISFEFNLEVLKWKSGTQSSRESIKVTAQGLEFGFRVVRKRMSLPEV